MFFIVCLLVMLHCAMVAVIVNDWLKCRKFNPVLDAAFWTASVGQYVGVSWALTSFMLMDTVYRVLSTVGVYALVYWLMPKSKGEDQ